MFESPRKWLGTIRVSSLLAEGLTPHGGGAQQPPATAETVRDIQITQTELLFEMDRGGTGRTILAFLVLTLLAPDEKTSLAWAAFSLYCAISLLYLRLHRAFAASEDWKDNPEHWAAWLTVMAIASGSAWGFGAANLYAPAHPEGQAFAAMLIMGVATASVVSRTMHFPAMLGFIVPATVPLLAAMVIVATPLSLMTACLGALLVVAILQGGRVLNRSQMDSIALRYMIGSLSEARINADQARKAAEAGSRAKSEFLAMMSHEVRTPLNGIMGIAQVLQISKLEGEQRKFVDAILESSKTLLTILNDILDISKMEAGRLDIEFSNFDLVAEIQRTAGLFSHEIAKKPVNLRVRASELESLQVHGDANRTRQILTNLVGNAVKFTDQGSITITAATLGSGLHPSNISDAAPLDAIVVSVADTGMGIRRKAIPELFKPFSQGDQSNTREFGGTGLGLNICRRLVELMGGEIGLASRHGEGSVFWFTLSPADPSLESEEEPSRIAG